MRYEKISSSEEWQPGQRYRLTFDLEPISVLVPENQRGIQINRVIESVGQDSRLRLISANTDLQSITLEVEAVLPSSPIAYVVVSLISLALITAAIYITLRSVERVTLAGGDALDKAGPLFTGGLGIALAAAAVITVFLVIKR